MLDVIVVGLTMVFLIFLILYGVFRLFEWIFYRRPSRRAVEAVPVEVEDGEIVAAIAAALSVFMEKEVRVRSVRAVESGEKFVVWRKTGWKGVRRWRGSSGWS